MTQFATASQGVTHIQRCLKYSMQLVRTCYTKYYYNKIIQGFERNLFLHLDKILVYDQASGKLTTEKTGLSLPESKQCSKR